MLDMRPPKPFAKEHVPGAVNFQFNRADLADRAEMALPQEGKYLVHAEPVPIAKVAMDILTKAGFTVEGFLDGGLKGWKDAGLATEELPLIDVDQLKAGLDGYRVIDTRERFEFKYGHVPGSEVIEWTEPWSVFEEVTRFPHPLAHLAPVAHGNADIRKYLADFLAQDFQFILQILKTPLRPGREKGHDRKPALLVDELVQFVEINHPERGQKPARPEEWRRNSVHATTLPSRSRRLGESGRTSRPSGAMP